jgi:hypothetical protein
MVLRRLTVILPVFLLVLAQLPAGAWGEDGHIWINEAAAMRLPQSMPQFFGSAVARLGYLGPEPDRWRNAAAEPNLKYAQEPDHFLDMERLPADFGDLPVGRNLYIRRLYEARAKALAAGVDPKKADELLPEKIGFQPYITIEIMDRLRVAFREYRHARAEKKSTYGLQQNIIFYAGWMGHYVADAAQPLHTTVNYDGWVQDNPNGYRTEKGIHSEFETRFVREALRAPKELLPSMRAPRVVEKPFLAYQGFLKASNALVPQLYRLERAGAFRGKGTEEGREFTRQRLAAGAQMLADLWYTAWMESAVDPPDPYAPRKPDAVRSKAKKSGMGKD